MSIPVIKKEDGNAEPFDRTKLLNSLMKANTSVIVANRIVDEVSKAIKPGISSEKIFQMSFELLRTYERGSALRYSIRRSLLNLGPTGFPFEKFISKVLSKNGYQTQTGIMLKGKCTDHEIDILAISPNNELFLCEAKFHNDNFLKSDTKVALYIKARFEDLKESSISAFGQELFPKRMLLITNTKFTEGAIKYSNCAGIDLISWNYPEKGNLHDLVYESDTYPITILENLSQSEKIRLISDGIITCDDLLKSELLNKFEDSKRDLIKSEIADINSK